MCFCLFHNIFVNSQNESVKNPHVFMSFWSFQLAPRKNSKNNGKMLKKHSFSLQKFLPGTSGRYLSLHEFWAPFVIFDVF